jgi:hypothetical protein
VLFIASQKFIRLMLSSYALLTDEVRNFFLYVLRGAKGIISEAFQQLLNKYRLNCNSRFDVYFEILCL